MEVFVSFEPDERLCENTLLAVKQCNGKSMGGIVYFSSYCYPGLQTICCGFRALEQVGEICLYGAISEGRRGAGGSIDDGRRKKLGERERSIDME